MRVIDLDAARWNEVLDFYDDVLKAVGAPDWHGKSIDALIDSIVWGGINAVEPPYTIRISNVGDAPKDVIDEIELAKQAISDQRLYFQEQEGHDVEVQIDVVP